MREEAFEPAVLHMLEAAAVPDLWPAALHELATACGASGAISHHVVPGQATRSVWSKGVAEHFESYLAAGWDVRNTRMERSMALVMRGWRGIITEQDAFTPEDLARDPFHQEWGSPRGYTSYAGAVVASAPGMFLPISLERRKHEEPFTRSEVARLNRLFAHLQTAGALAMKIATSAAARLADTLGALGQAAALLDRHGRVVAMNARFDGLIGDGLRIVAGRPTASHPLAEQILTSAIHRVVAFDGLGDEPLQPVVLPRTDGRRPLVAQVTPVIGAAGDIFQSGCAIIMLTDLEHSPKAPSALLLKQAFGLTQAEARLAELLAEGLTLEEAAGTEGLSRETIRTRLKAVFAKTGTRRQAELVALLARLQPWGGKR